MQCNRNDVGHCVKATTSPNFLWYFSTACFKNIKPINQFKARINYVSEHFSCLCTLQNRSKKSCKSQGEIMEWGSTEHYNNVMCNSIKRMEKLVNFHFSLPICLYLVFHLVTLLCTFLARYFFLHSSESSSCEYLLFNHDAV